MLFPVWTLTLLLGIIVILLVFLKLLFNKQQTFRQQPSADESFALFMDEWQKENEALLHALTEIQQDILSRVDAIQARVAQLEAKTTHEDEAVSQRVTDRESVTHAADFRQRHAEIANMAAKGMTVAEIARQTGRGNGEVRLILGLAARGQSHE